MTDDYTREIRERLEKAIPNTSYDLPDHYEFCKKASTDIANLLAEREVLRDALKWYANNFNEPMKDGLTPYKPGHIAREALAWRPEEK